MTFTTPTSTVIMPAHLFGGTGFLALISSGESSVLQERRKVLKMNEIIRFFISGFI